jgi:hypothetical protein
MHVLSDPMQVAHISMHQHNLSCLGQASDMMILDGEAEGLMRNIDRSYGGKIVKKFVGQFESKNIL